MTHINTKQGKKITKNNKIKNTKIKIKCVGGGGNLLHLICLISNTMPQLLLLHLLISRKGKPKQQQAWNPP